MTIKGMGNVYGKWAYICPDCNKYMVNKLYKSLLAEINTNNCKKDIIHIIGNAESLLNQLKDQNNDK